MSSPKQAMSNEPNVPACLYQGLFLVTILLIVTTLPRAIIAWKERG